jgi:hypothetical protein
MKEFKSWSPLPPFLDHLDNQTILTKLPMVVTMHDDNISAFNVAILSTSSGTVPSLPVKPVIKSHQDMHHEHVEDVFMMMVSADITILKESMMETLPESVDFHMLFFLILLYLSVVNI